MLKWWFSCVENSIILLLYKGGHMKNIKAFLKKNGFFVFLLSVMLIIIIALGIYIYISNRAVKTPAPAKPAVIQKKPKKEKKAAEITSFEGEYNQSNKSIKVGWTYEQNDDRVNKVTLYLNGNYIDDVSSFSYYDFPKDTYGYPTGTNVVKLVLSLDNGKTVEKSIHVFVNYLLGATQSVKQTDNSTQITLTYEYEQAHPIKVPSITTDSQISSDAQYIGTTQTEANGIITAKTTYEFFWPEHPVIYQQFVIRWKFNDIKESCDFDVVKGTPPKN